MALYQRGKSWYYDFVYHGTRYTGSLGPLSKTRAKEVYTLKRAAAVNGATPVPSRRLSPPFAEAAAAFLAAYATQHKPNSTRRHQAALKPLAAFFGPARLAEITPLNIEQYRTGRKALGRSDVTINRELICLHTLFQYALRWLWVRQNPLRDIRRPPEPLTHTRWLTDDEETRLLACATPQLRPVLLVALHTGLRYTELRTLTWQRIDLRRRVLTVVAAYAKNAETRAIPLNRTALTTLQGLKAQEGWQRGVFLNRRGEPYKDWSTPFRTARRQAGLPDLRFHDLRHTFASRLVMAGQNIRTVQVLLGHKDIKQTMRYAHLSTTHLQDATTVLDR